MGGSSSCHTQRSTTAPWMVHSGRAPVEFVPLYKPMPWHLENPWMFAVMLGSAITGILWLLS